MFLRDQKGVFPLFILIIIGVAVTAGGTYLVREQFVKTGQSGKSELDSKKIQEQINKPKPLPSLSPTPKTELQTGAFKYKQPENQVASSIQDEDREPSFSIYPPSGWDRSSQSDSVIKVVFLAPEEDKEATGDDLEAINKAKIQVNVIKGSGNGNLESLTDYFISSSKSGWESLQVNSKTKTTFAGQPSYKVAADAFRKGVTFKTLSYVFIKGKYGIVVYGGALESAWDKRASEINNSLNSFKLSD